jgi:hypothetical protein
MPDMVFFLVKNCNSHIGQSINAYQGRSKAQKAPGNDWLNEAFYLKIEGPDITSKKDHLAKRAQLSSANPVIRSKANIVPVGDGPSLSKLKTNVKCFHSNPEEKDPFAFNFIKRHEKKQKRETLKEFNRTAMLCSTRTEKSEPQGATRTEPGEDYVSQAMRVVVVELGAQIFNDRSANRAQLSLHSKKSALKMTRQGLLSKILQ